jgi:hypothetical protein
MRSLVISHRKQRLKDFEKRVKIDPTNVMIDLNYNWQLIPIHPMADELELLAQLGVKPEKCREVDAYWQVNNDVFFLQVISYDPTWKNIGLYVRLNKHAVPFMINLVAIVEEPTIITSVFEQVLKQFYAWIVTNQIYQVEGEKLVPLTELEFVDRHSVEEHTRHSKR